MLLLLIAVLFFLLLPTTLPREGLPEPGSLVTLSKTALAYLQSIDPETNCFPSLHVAAPPFLAIVSARIRPNKAVWFSFVWIAVIAYSTLATRQHVYIDIAGAAVLAVAMSIGVNRDKWSRR